MKKYLIISLGLIFLSSAAWAADKVSLKDDTARISYSLGFQIGGDFRKQDVSINPEAVVAGIQDALASHKPQLSAQEMKDLLISLKKKVVETQQREIYNSGKTFLAENRKKPGVTELPSGIQYLVLKEGDGDVPSMEDTVDIHFKTTKLDGTVIASTHGKENKPRTYQVKKTLPAMQQVLHKMKVGSKWQVVIPPTGGNEVTEGGGVLIYEIELLAIHPPSGKG